MCCNCVSEWTDWCCRYIVWENLLHLLREHQAQTEVYLGRFFRTVIPHGFMSGGAGYVISKPAVRKVVDEGPKFVDCQKEGQEEDVNIAR